jgi:hypothetical protein
MMQEHLIIVAGHATFKAEVEACPSDPTLDKYWALQSFQVGEPSYYIEHISASVEQLKKDPLALLMFTGGVTREGAGDWSEAATYQAVAEHYKYWGLTPERLADDIALEEYSRDSLQNVEYCLRRFHQLRGRYPTHVTVVGWGFKADRFDLHRQTLGIPREKFTYIGVNQPADLDDAMRGEARTLEQFRLDPMGVKPPLADKREERNPRNQKSPYSSEPIMLEA